jgi:hypothetical protein
VETVGHRLAGHVPAATAQDRSQGGTWAHQGQEVPGDAVEFTSVDHGETGESAAPTAQAHHRQREGVKLSAAKHGIVWRPKCWVVARSNAWAACFRRLARDEAQLAETRKGWHFVAFALLRLKHFVELLL